MEDDHGKEGRLPREGRKFIKGRKEDYQGKEGSQPLEGRKMNRGKKEGR